MEVLMPSPECVMPRYVMPRYVMFDQTQDKVGQIMHESPQSNLVTRPSWVALTLLIVAFNIIAASSA
jgi:hypothetical protein